MVLTRALAVLASLASLGACNQSLFDSHGPGGGGDDNTGDDANGDAPAVVSMCPATCLADAAGDFGAATLRYLDDHRDRTWADMTASGTALVGANPANGFTTCAQKPTAPACAMLPGALLVSSAGATSAADPAVSYTATANAVLQLSAHVHVPAGSTDQDVRIYRNSREDVLVTKPAVAGTTVDLAITVDALANDRFYFALAPTAMGATDVAAHYYVNNVGAVFPTQCQVAVQFQSATGNTVDNLCGVDFTYTDTTSGALPPVLVAGPFTELGQAADVPPDKYYERTPLIDKTGDTTTQFWARLDVLDPTYAQFMYSDMDLDFAGGLAIDIFDNGGSPRVELGTCTAVSPALAFNFAGANWPNDSAWHFVRVVHTAGTAYLCVDGKRATSITVAQGKLASTYPPFFGKNVKWSPSGAYFDGALDDMRVLSTALPCD